MDGSLDIHLNLINSEVIKGKALKINAKSLELILDAKVYRLKEVSYVLLPDARRLSKSLQGLQASYLDETIELKLKTKTTLNLSGFIINFYKDAVIVIGRRNFGVSAIIPLDSIKSYKLGVSMTDDNYAEELLQQAIISKASDIHLKPRKDHIQVQLRIDGVLHNMRLLHNT